MNEDRARFLASMQLGFCSAGNHATPGAYEYGTGSWCPEHPCPAGPPDLPRTGRCKVGRPHSAQVVYWVPVLGYHVCRKHFDHIVSEVLRRGSWGT